jgi:hypothetical protein
MFRRFRYRRWLVAGIGIAAFVVPTTALAGANTVVVDGRNPDTIDAAFAAQAVSDGRAPGTIDAAMTSRADRLSPLDGRSPDTKDAALAATEAKVDPMAIRYLLRYGYTPSQITAMLAGTYHDSTQSTIPQTPADGRSPDTIDFAAQAHSPVVTVVREPGFQWGDFGIGGGAALAAMILLALSVRFLASRQGRGGHKPVTSS